MLDSAVKFLAEELNGYLFRQTSLNDFVKVESSQLVDDSGKLLIQNNRIALTVVNVEEERVLRSPIPERALVNGSHVTLQPELKLNLILLFTVRITDYLTALRYLSYLLVYFQSHPSFTPDEYPSLNGGIEKLSLELLSYGPEQLNQLWAYLGTKYLPSVVYRVRMVVLRDTEPHGIGQPITSIIVGVNGK